MESDFQHAQSNSFKGTTTDRVEIRGADHGGEPLVEHPTELACRARPAARFAVGVSGDREDGAWASASPFGAPRISGLKCFPSNCTWTFALFLWAPCFCSIQAIRIMKKGFYSHIFCCVACSFCEQCCLCIVLSLCCSYEAYYVLHGSSLASRIEWFRTKKLASLALSDHMFSPRPFFTHTEWHCSYSYMHDYYLFSSSNPDK